LPETPKLIFVKPETFLVSFTSDWLAADPVVTVITKINADKISSLFIMWWFNIFK
jgi:hypothetical protein